MKAKTFLFAFLTWFIPMLISMFMYNPQTGEYLPNFIVFKIVMVGLLFGLTYWFYRMVRQYESKNWLLIATMFTIFCSVLDFAVLITLFKFSISLWAMAILPFYLISFYMFGYLILNKKVAEKA